MSNVGNYETTTATAVGVGFSTVKDNWAHRSENMRCSRCMWYAPKAGNFAAVGRCRRHAPTMNGFPAVYDTDWCGDHKIDENKA